MTSASADHGGTAVRYTRSGRRRSTQGGLLHVGFGHQVRRARPSPPTSRSRSRWATQAFDRFGRTGDGAARYAWIGSAQPLLAWERGYGWHSEDLIEFTAESATSEAMDTDLTVTAPGAETVIMSGDPVATAGVGVGLRTWHATIATARDVSVAVGPFAVTDTRSAPTRLRRRGVLRRRARPAGAAVPPRSDDADRAVRAVPVPVAVGGAAARSGGGIEYPSSIMMLDGEQLVAVHETAHQWFYAMLGDSQARHPWLDEAFATYAEQLVNSDPGPSCALAAPGRSTARPSPTAADADTYYFITYNKGSAALQAARMPQAPQHGTPRCAVTSRPTHGGSSIRRTSRRPSRSSRRRSRSCARRARPAASRVVSRRRRPAWRSGRRPRPGRRRPARRTAAGSRACRTPRPGRPRPRPRPG